MKQKQCNYRLQMIFSYYLCIQALLLAVLFFYFKDELVDFVIFDQPRMLSNSQMLNFILFFVFLLFYLVVFKRKKFLEAFSFVNFYLSIGIILVALSLFVLNRDFNQSLLRLDLQEMNLIAKKSALGDFKVIEFDRDVAIRRVDSKIEKIKESSLASKADDLKKLYEIKQIFLIQNAPQDKTNN